MYITVRAVAVCVMEHDILYVYQTLPVVSVVHGALCQDNSEALVSPIVFF